MLLKLSHLSLLVKTILLNEIKMFTAYKICDNVVQVSAVTS